VDSDTRRPQVKRGPLGGLEALTLWCGGQGSSCGIGFPALPVAAALHAASGDVCSEIGWAVERAPPATIP